MERIFLLIMVLIINEEYNKKLRIYRESINNYKSIEKRINNDKIDSSISKLDSISEEKNRDEINIEELIEFEVLVNRPKIKKEKLLNIKSDLNNSNNYYENKIWEHRENQTDNKITNKDKKEDDYLVNKLDFKKDKLKEDENRLEVLNNDKSYIKDKLNEEENRLEIVKQEKSYIRDKLNEEKNKLEIVKREKAYIKDELEEEDNKLEIVRKEKAYIRDKLNEEKNKLKIVRKEKAYIKDKLEEEDNKLEIVKVEKTYIKNKNELNNILIENKKNKLERKVYKDTIQEKLNIVESKKSISSILKDKYRGVKMSVSINNIGIITGEVVLNMESVVGLKTEDGTIIFINEDKILGFF